MPRYAAFLRAINVGGHVVKMEALRRHFEALGFTAVETFLASGNVVFEATAGDPGDLERPIATRLRDGLGYEVATFVRTAAEVVEVAAAEPFTAAELEGAVAVNVAFTAEPLDADAQRRLRALRTDLDEFRVRGREVYWLCRTRQSQSSFSNAVLEKLLGRPSTLRGMATVRKMAAKVAGDALQ